jgi:hypothetical protein
VAVDVVVYDAVIPGDSCSGPGMELCRVPVVCDQETFKLPQWGTVVFPEPCCVYGPFYAGIEYTDTILVENEFASVIHDSQIHPMSGDCNVWYKPQWGDYQEEKTWWESCELGICGGYPLFTIEGETQSPGCQTLDVLDCRYNPPAGWTGGGGEFEDNDSCVTATMAQCGKTYCGTISGPGDVDWWQIDLPADTCHCSSVRVYANDTPGQAATGGGLDPEIFVYGEDCQSLLLANDNYGGVFPDAEGNDAQIDCHVEGNLFQPGTRLYVKVSSEGSGGTIGDYLFSVSCAADNCPPCCGRYTGGITGNTNCSTDGDLTLSDITRLVDRVYISKAPLCCEEAGNTNGGADGQSTLSDITRLIDRVYISRLPTSTCP